MRLSASAVAALFVSSWALAAPQPFPKELHFSKACEPGKKITIAAAGDVLLHDIPQIQATESPNRFISLWRPIIDLMQRTDMTYVNLEGTTAWGINRYQQEAPDPGFVFDDYVYSGIPYPNYHPYLLDDLVASGVDVVSTANNHALDRGPLGADRTIEALRKAGLPYTGTRFRSQKHPRWHTITEAKGIRIAWLACGFINENRAPDPEHQSLQCREDTEEIERIIREIVRKKEADAVIVTPHWGKQFLHEPRDYQLALARRFLEAGAIAVLSSHPHVIQPWEKITTSDGREGFVIYSMGNFVNGHRQLPRRATVLVNLGLTKTRSGKVHINGVKYTPLLMTREEVNGKTYVEMRALDRHPRRDASRDVLAARELLTGLLGDRNIAHPDEPLVTNPECRGQLEASGP